MVSLFSLLPNRITHVLVTIAFQHAAGQAMLEAKSKVDTKQSIFLCQVLGTHTSRWSCSIFGC